MLDTIAGVSVNDKFQMPDEPFRTFAGEMVTVIGFRYYTSRNNGRTSLVADYMTDDGRTSFDGLDRVKQWKMQACAD